MPDVTGLCRRAGARIVAIMQPIRAERSAMKIGIGLPAAVPGVETALITRWARSAEAHGFDALGVIDRVVYDNHEPLMTLAAAAVVTERIELLTDVLIAPIRATALLAKQAATLDRLSGGRLTLGLGLGGRVQDFTAVGMLTDGRGRRFDQQLRDLRELWSGDRIGPAPARPGGPPLIAAGYAPRAIERAARLADGWCAGVGRIEQFTENAALLRDAWSRHGRAGRPRILAFAYYALGAGGREVTERELRHYYAWLGREAVDEIAASALTEPAAIVDWLAAHADAGADEALLMPCSVDLVQVELLADALAGPRSPRRVTTAARRGRRAAGTGHRTADLGPLEDPRMVRIGGEREAEEPWLRRPSRP
jgi:alkanesulfonate monooxygenase SsuD/methylene tetrahydromethanopterin reductase-like flavin-dependent oxidoreductase (luciferase family)